MFGMRIAYIPARKYLDAVTGSSAFSVQMAGLASWHLDCLVDTAGLLLIWRWIINGIINYAENWMVKLLLVLQFDHFRYPVKLN